jgi:hypothetical protein
LFFFCTGTKYESLRVPAKNLYNNFEKERQHRMTSKNKLKGESGQWKRDESEPYPLP